MGRTHAGYTLLVMVLWLTPTGAFAMLHPEQGRFMQRDLWKQNVRMPLAGDDPYQEAIDQGLGAIRGPS